MILPAKTTTKTSQVYLPGVDSVLEKNIQNRQLQQTTSFYGNSREIMPLPAPNVLCLGL